VDIIHGWSLFYLLHGLWLASLGHGTLDTVQVFASASHHWDELAGASLGTGH
jgi:hypothetical protein